MLSPDNLTFLAGSFLVPALLVWLSFVTRHSRKWYYTAGSDFLFTEMTFSFASAVLWKDMAAYIHNDVIRQVSVTIFIVMGLALLICWYWAVSRVEVEINEAIRKKSPPSSVPQRKIFFAWGMAVTFFALEIMTFLYK